MSAEERIPNFGSRTAAELVEKGLVRTVLNYIERIAAGGYA